MAAQGGEHVYATLLLNDAYLPGALVLAHSLRDAGTTKKLAVLVTLDSVSGEVITQLKTVYDHIIPVPRIRNAKPANLYLMNRPDLHSAFTKINLWKQTQFSRIVYVDADVVAYRAPDELFDLGAPFSAAPDIGWPDLFNTGVMALTPNMGDYYALMAMAERGISFDGADQGLLNMHFKNSYNRISFTYNVTPSAHYQYIPAYRHFQSSINMVHFIGQDKPWFQGRTAATSDTPFDEMVGRWWAVYDRHYRAQETATAPELVRYFVKGEFQPTGITSTVPSGEHRRDREDSSRDSHYYPPPAQTELQPVAYGSSEHGREHYGHDAHGHIHDEPQPPPPGAAWQQTEQQIPTSSESFSHIPGTKAEARQEQVPKHDGRGPSPQPIEQKHEPPPVQSWDAQRQPPPLDSKPEAINFPRQIYEMSNDPAPFVPPERYPSPPRGMYYETPRDPPAPPTQRPRAIFPWEGHQPRPSRVFAGELLDEPSPTSQFTIPTGEQEASHDSRALTEPSTTGTTTTESKPEPVTPVTPSIRVQPSDPWTSFTRTNAWDEVPAIERYVEGLQKHHRRRSQAAIGSSTMTGTSDTAAEDQGDRTWRVTDFPSEVERPSLPVTPAPQRRPKFWGGGHPGDGDDDQVLPAAEGVPAQSDWDPVAQLQKLARQQSEALLRRLSGEESGTESREIPLRPLPYGSDGVVSPQYVAQSPGGVVLSPQPLKKNTTAGVVRSMMAVEPESSIPRTVSEAESSAAAAIAEPSYTGPGVAFEKGEDIPLKETPALPSEEELDVLET